MAISDAIYTAAKGLQKAVSGISGSSTADRGVDSSTSVADRGLGNSNNANNGSGGSAVYSSGGGGGSGSRSSGGGSPTKKDPNVQKELQATANNLGDIYGRKKKQLEKDTKAKLDNIDKQIAANNAEHDAQKMQIATHVNWQPQQQKEQSTLMALRNRMGNSAYGSAMVDLQEGMSRVDDMADVELINTHKMNLDNAYNNWFQANSELVADYNSAAAEAESSMADLFNQYQAALNNVSAGAASTKNIKNAGKKAKKVATTKAAYKAAKKTASTKAKYQKAKKAISKAKTASAKKKAQTAAQKALKAYKKAKSVSKGNVNKALKAYKKAKSAAKVGYGDKKITLKNVNFTPSSSFKSITATRNNASAVNPATLNYIRPDAGAARGGEYNTAGNANSAFADNLNAYRH